MGHTGWCFDPLTIQVSMALYVLVLGVALTRLLPHPPNFACVGALALFAGYTMRSWWGFAIPLIALLISDVAGHLLAVPGMGFYSPMMMLMVYGGFAAVTAVGRIIGSANATSGRGVRAARIGGGAIAGATAFFLISNLGVFLGGAYGLSWVGLVACYTAALPFFLNTLAGDLFFATVLFGSAAVVGKLDGIVATRLDSAARVKIAD
jgi:hypothetical protein